MPSKFSEPFTKMAVTLDHNELEPFSGAAVIVPPGHTTSPIEVVQFGSNADEGQFWATVLTAIQMRMKKIEEQQASQRGFGIR
jgi:phosphopantothenoylcysteine synthetase/decarboxylase